MKVNVKSVIYDYIKSHGSQDSNVDIKDIPESSAEQLKDRILQIKEIDSVDKMHCFDSTTEVKLSDKVEGLEQASTEESIQEETTLEESLQEEDETDISNDLIDNCLDDFDVTTSNLIAHELTTVDVENIEVEPIVLNSIQDTYNSIQKHLDKITIETGLHVIPTKVFKFAEQLDSIQGYEKCTVNGISYFMSNIVRDSLIADRKEKIITQLENGLVYSETLSQTSLINSIHYETLSMTKKEWSYLVALFKNYNAKVFVTDTDKIVLTVGEDLW